MVGAKVSKMFKMYAPTTTLSLRTLKACLFAQEAPKLDDATPSYVSSHHTRTQDARRTHAGRTQDAHTHTPAPTHAPRTPCPPHTLVALCGAPAASRSARHTVLSWSFLRNGRHKERGVSSGVSKVFPGKRRLKLSRDSKPCIFD